MDANVWKYTSRKDPVECCIFERQMHSVSEKQMVRPGTLRPNRRTDPVIDTDTIESGITQRVHVLTSSAPQRKQPARALLEIRPLPAKEWDEVVLCGECVDYLFVGELILRKNVVETPADHEIGKSIVHGESAAATCAGDGILLSNDLAPARRTYERYGKLYNVIRHFGSVQKIILTLGSRA
jgi:hypothetical protein